MRKILKILLIVPVLYLIVIPVFFMGYSNSRRCGSISVDINDSSDYHFVTRHQLLNLINGSREKIFGQQLKDLSVTEIEGRIGVLKEVKEAEVYTTIDGSMHVFVDQRDPIMMIIPDNGGDFIIDKDGVVVRNRNLYTPRLHIVTGNVNISSVMLNGMSVLDTSIKKTILKDIYYLVNYINNDRFWSAQIDQINVDDNEQIDLIPRVGNQVIHMGTTENTEGKLRNLAAFYDKVLPEVGWNRYSLINLEYKDQIVCKKR